MVSVTRKYLVNGTSAPHYDVVVNANANGQPVTAYNPLPVTSSSDAKSSGHDAFGRLRVSNPLTLFDSSHRFADNDLWSEDTTGTASSTFNANAGLMEFDIGTASGDELLRETKKVFTYQPGKSLLIMTTFVFAAPKENLRQRVGYFGEKNGMYLEQDDTTINFVERNFVTGSVTETRVEQSNWNIDKLNGSGPSGIILDLTKAQILWMDIEWLGLGSVRMGVVVDGALIPCHAFHHANLIDSTYITTASLPLRQEITNTGITTTVSKAKQICSTVISEGGYGLVGRQQAVGTPITAPKDIALAGVFYPVVSIRLKTTPDRLDAVVIPTAISVMGDGNGINFNWQVVAGSSTTAGSWVSAGSNSAVDYNITGTAVSGGRVLASGFINSSNQGSPTTDILKEALFKFQLERNTFTGTPEELTLQIACQVAGQEVFGSMDWEEVTR